MPVFLVHNGSVLNNAFLFDVVLLLILRPIILQVFILLLRLISRL